MGAGRLHRPGEALDGEGIFRPDVDDAFPSADGVGPDEHPFQDHVWVAFHLVAVHVGARVSLVGVADDIFLKALFLFREVPLHARGKPRAPAPPQARCDDLVDDLVWGKGRDRLEGSTVASHGEILVDVFRVDESRVPQDDLSLGREVGNLVIRGNLLETGPEDEFVSHERVPFIDPAQGQFPGHVAFRDCLDNFLRVVFRNPVENHEGFPGKLDIDEGFLPAIPDAPDLGEVGRVPAFPDRRFQRGVNTIPARGDPARGESHRDAGYPGHERCAPFFPEGLKVFTMRDNRFPPIQIV